MKIIPKAKYTVGDTALVIKWGKTLADSYHYFGCIVGVTFDPDLDPATDLPPVEVPILYQLDDLVLLDQDKHDEAHYLLWEHEITEVAPMGVDRA